LIAEPFLEDPSFVRTVVLICENDETGTFGLVLNKKIEETLGDLIPDFEGIDIPVYSGGPVEEHTLHVLHTLPDELGGEKISGGLHFGTQLERLKNYLLTAEIDNNKIKFFVGYSGWETGQLNEELKIESWLVAPTSEKVIFSQSTENFYKESLSLLGEEYKYYFMLPKNPSLN
jgi:putative transcriptional regulator